MGRSREQHREYMREYRARKRAEKAATAADASAGVTPADSEPPALPTPSTRHADAVDRMLRETGLSRLDEEMPLVELLRDLASELDTEPLARTRQQYLTALRDARRVLAAAPGSAVPATSKSDEAEAPAPTETPLPVAEVEPEVADFERFRRAKGGTSGG